MKPSRLPSVFKSKAPKRFSYTPRCFDPDKEDFEYRKSRIRKELEYERKHGKFEDTANLWGRTARKNAIKQSNYRLIFIGGLLVAICYVMMKAVTKF